MQDYNHIYTESNERRVETLGEQNTAEPDQKMKHGEETLKTMHNRQTTENITGSEMTET